jgi:hypothetical protein
MLAAREGRPVWEPFCGGLGMSAQWGAGPLVLSDACAPLITMYEAFASGWLPLEHVTPEERDAVLALPDSDPLKAFARFGCGFGGAWDAGCTQGGYDWNGDSFAAQARRSLARTFSALPLDVEFTCLDFVAEEPFAEAAGALIYCDPPYGGTYDYAAVGPFDRLAFIERVRQWAGLGALVFVSEFDFPIGEIVWSAERARHMPAAGVAGRQARGVTCERLYRIG